MAKTTWVRRLLGSWEGLTSSDVAIGKFVGIFVDCKFFCCIRRWPLLVARDLLRCLVTRSVVRPGHDWKKPLLIAQRNVDGTGL